ncbi:MAG: glycerol-3-phosphate acyltransferase [Chloroflexi bacterium]|nr:glycerol-3-phosphate acyltransferase [Chloroflexota bacterium]
MTTIIWVILSFLAGSLPFSVWVGRLALQKDVRQYGDGNPGASNVFRAGGKGWGVLAVLLDGFKGAIPVGIAYYGVGLEGWGLTAVAIAPILGHAFSPFLRFRGGKALATTFGVWLGLTLWWGPTTLGLAFAFWRWLLAVDGWAVMAGMLTLLVVLLLVGAPPALLAAWLGNALILAWKHREDLRQRVGIRPLAKK